MHPSIGDPQSRQMTTPQVQVQAHPSSPQLGQGSASGPFGDVSSALRIIWSDSDAWPGDAMRFVRSEAKKGTHELGFVPWPRVERDAAKGRLLVLTANDDLVAWLLLGIGGGRFGTVCPIVQLWTRLDARRFWFASEAVLAAGRKAHKEGRTELQARCSLDLLPANLLWVSLGFVPVALRRGGRVRERKILLWRLGLG